MTREPLVFVKSRHSQNGDCVQWAFTPGSVFVSDSKDADGPVLRADVAEWRDFTGSVAAGVPGGDGLAWCPDGRGVSVFRAGEPAHRLWFTAAEWSAFVAAARSGEVLGRAARSA